MSILFILFSQQAGLAQFNLEPEIQCTILKTYKTSEFAVFKKPLVRYQSFSHYAVKSKSQIFGEEINTAKVSVKHRRVGYEEIEVKLENKTFVLKIHGFPISRKGELFFEEKKIADLTCH